MSIVNFKESLINNYLLIASFDKKTHKCEWLKRHGEVMDQPKVYNEGSYFFSEMVHYVHPNDVVRLEQNVGEDKIYTIKDTVMILHMLDNGKYKPYYAEFTSDENYTYFTIRNANAGFAALDDALLCFEQTFIKVIKANLDTGVFHEIKIFEQEKPALVDFYEWAEMVIQNLVFDTDKEPLREFLNPDVIYDNLMTSKHLTFSYRRWYKNKWIIAMLHVVPSFNFGNGNNEVILYVSKI